MSWVFTLFSFFLPQLLAVFTYPFVRQNLDYPIERLFSDLLSERSLKELFLDQMRKAKEAERQKNYAGAYQAYRRAMDFDPTNATLLFDIAQFCEKH